MLFVRREKKKKKKKEDIGLASKFSAIIPSF
jgi:hypothetical protein